MFQWNQYETMINIAGFVASGLELTTVITKASLAFFCCLQHSFSKMKEGGKVLIAFCAVGKEVQTAKRPFPDMLLDNWPPITAVLLKIIPPTLAESKK